MDAIVKLGIVQADAVIGDVEGNLGRLETLVVQAAEAGADLVVTPELFATGYDPAGAAAHDAEAIRGRLSAIARAAGVALVASTVDHSGPHICASFFIPSGEEIARVAKHHLFDVEKHHFVPGPQYGELVSWQGLAFGLGICFDVEFPEFGRALARAGAQVLLVPTAVPVLDFHLEPQAEAGGPRGAWSYSATQTSTLQVPARALENGVVIAYANHCGPGFTGHSCIATPFGHNAALIDDGRGVAVVEVSAAAIAQARKVNPYLLELGDDPARG